METAQNVEPFQIDLETDSITHRREEYLYEGDKAETNIVMGKEKIFEEKDREWLKERVEGTGVDLSKIEGALNLKEQAKNLAEVLGLERANKMVDEVLVELLKSPGGNVSKGEVTAEEVSDFAKKYLNKEQKIQENTWQEKVYCRINAIVSSTSKILWILAADSEEEALRRQNTNGVLKHLRERVLRGCERAKEIVPTDIKRYGKAEGEEEVIRFLPKGGVSEILAHLTSV